jgi:hypothetical protein
MANVDYLSSCWRWWGFHFHQGGGGGAGGFRESYNPVSGSYSASPLATPTGLPVSVTSYPITVGGGRDQGPTTSPSNCGANNGSNSVFQQ